MWMAWEAGSQNWTANFPAEFKKRRGYDLLPWLVTMTGVPVNSAETSEKILYDVRQTIAELVNEVFYVTVKNEAKARGCLLMPKPLPPLCSAMDYLITNMLISQWANSGTIVLPPR